MAKSRKLNEEVIEEQLPQSDLKTPEVKKSRQANGRFIEESMLGALITYLQSKPHNEVDGVIKSLSSLPGITVTIEEPA